MPKKHDPQWAREKRWCGKEARPKKMERESVKKRSCHPLCALAWSDSKHKYYFSMDPIFDVATDVIQVCAFIFPAQLYFSHLTSREEKTSSGKDTHMSDTDRSNKRVRPWIIFLVQNLQKSQTCSKIWRVLESGHSNLQLSKTARKKLQGSQTKVRYWITFMQVVFIKKKDFLP